MLPSSQEKEFGGKVREGDGVYDGSSLTNRIRADSSREQHLKPLLSPLQHQHLNPATMAVAQLLANYKSPTATQMISLELPAVPKDGGSVQDKTAYLSALRVKATEMQSEINTFLTQKMEEDKAAEAGSKSVADQKEEENYGEEDPEGDA